MNGEIYGIENERVIQHLQAKDSHHDKAMRANDAGVQVKVWNERVVEQLT